MTPEPGTSAQPAIAADGLVKCFGDVEAVRGVSFEVPEGRVLGLLGPNGAGKTTVVRMLTTLARPDGGTARVLGLDVGSQPQRVRNVIGLAGQYAAIDENLTGRENLRLVGKLSHLAPRAIGARADELLERFALADAANRVARTYSGGMRRRLDLAAALVHRPPVLFLDEPTTGLDPQGRTELWHVIEDLVDGGTTVLLTTQYLEEADTLADNIVVIDHGTVIAEGTAADLKAQLGATTIEIGFRDDADATTAAALLASVGGVDQDGKLLHLSVAGDHGAGSMLQTVRVLDDARLEPATLVLREPTLDDVFLSLTGHAAEDDDGNGNGNGNGTVRRRRGRRQQRAGRAQ
jgi:ABC-2 type transport system ATP-binding protein